MPAILRELGSIIGTAFDQVWATVASGFDTALAREAARLVIANAILGLATKVGTRFVVEKTREDRFAIEVCKRLEDPTLVIGSNRENGCPAIAVYFCALNGWLGQVDVSRVWLRLSLARLRRKLGDGPRTPHPKGVPGMCSRRRIHAGAETRSQACCRVALGGPPYRQALYRDIE